MVQGVANLPGNYEGKKLLIVFRYKTANPLPTATVFELDPGYNTLLPPEEQGYSAEDFGTWTGAVFPIVGVIGDVPPAS